MKRIFINAVYIFLTAAFLLGCTTEDGVNTSNGKTIEYINPEGLSKTNAYTQVIAAAGNRTIYISGQVPMNKAGEIVGKDDFRAQALKAFENMQIALNSAGATFKDVVKVTYYIKNYSPERLQVIREMRAQFFDKENPPCATLVGVQSLFLDDVMIEVEAIASLKIMLK